MKIQQSEHSFQCAVMKWASFARCKHPELDLLFAIPNGGARHFIVAKKLKAEGVKAGVPDLLLPVARGGYHGLFIELKVGKNKPSGAQTWWHLNLVSQDYKVLVLRDFDSVVREIEEYLKGCSCSLMTRLIGECRCAQAERKKL